MSGLDDEEKAFRAALEAVSKKFEAKIPGLLAEITGIRENLESLLEKGSVDGDATKEGVAELLRRTHTLAGSAGQFGHQDLTELARSVEEMCLSVEASNFENADAFPLLFQLTKDVENYKY